MTSPCRQTMRRVSRTDRCLIYITSFSGVRVEHSRLDRKLVYDRKLRLELALKLPDHRKSREGEIGRD